MAGTIKGIIVEIGGDTSGLQKALKSVNSATSSLSKELRGINSLLKLDPSNTELLAQKQTVLAENIEQTSKKLEELKKVQEEANQDMSKISPENYRNLQREIINTENKLKQLQLEASNWTKAGRKVEEFGTKVENISNKIDTLGNTLTTSLTLPTIAIGTALVSNAMGLEDAVAKYISSTNTAKNETEKYKQVLENINNNNYGEGYEDIADSMAQVKMQLKNINEQDLQNITEKAIALRDLFGYDVSESVRAVKAMMDNFNVSADEAFNLITEGKKQGLDFSNELLDNVNEYSVQFGKLGLSAEDMFNIFKVGADNGAFNLDKIGDAVKEFSIRAIDGSNTTIDGFKRIGLNADTMAKKFASGGETAKQAFIEVVNRLGSMDDKVSQSVAGVDLFGTMWEDLGPTVITSFSKMDSGISQSSNSMQESIDELYDTTKKKAETQLKRLQGLGAEFGEEMLPVLEHLIDKVEKFVDNLEGMSDAEKENILKTALLVAAIGPAIKIIGTLGKGIGTVTKGIGTFSKAVGVLKTGAESSSESANKLANGMKWMTSSAGIATTAVTAVTIGIGLLKAQIDKEMKSISDASEELKTNVETRQASLDTINDELDANMSQIANTKQLREELSQLVDENGKVKEGYETRVQFILNELNSALGTEYKLNGDLIDSYDDLKDSIDEVIEKKQAQLILEANEEKYKEAIENKDKTMQDYLETQGKIEEVQGKINELQNQWSWRGSADMMMRVNEYKGQLEDLQTTLGQQDQQLQEYNNAINTYQQNSQLMIEGGAENYKKIEESVAQTQTNITTTANAGLTQRINDQIAANTKAKELYDLEAQYNEDAQNSIYATNVQKGQESLQALADELIAKTTTVGELGQDEIDAWKSLANNSYDVYSNAISKMSPEMQQKIQDITGVVAGDTTVQDETGKLAGRAEAKFEENDSKTWGSDMVEGIGEGIQEKGNSQWFKGILGGLSGLIASFLHFSRPDVGPLREYEKWMPDMVEGLAKSLDNSSYKLRNSARNLSGDLYKELDFGNFAKEINGQIIAKTQTIFTTPQIIFNVQEMNEENLNRCFNYINKKFGSKY